MASREKTARVDLKVRMKEPLRARIEAAAQDRGVSLNAEAEGRLERSFTDEDRFGGRETFGVTIAMLAAFIQGGQTTARADGHPRWGPSQWMQDGHCYQQAMLGVLMALWRDHPAPGGLEGARLIAESFLGRVATLATNKEGAGQ
jgi:hypothetical protein